MSRLDDALAEIGRRRELAQAAMPLLARMRDASASLRWEVAVLDAAEATLRRHGQFSALGLAPGDWCPFDGQDYPCADLLAVLDIYALDEP